jgi:dihydroxyacetone kinase
MKWEDLLDGIADVGAGGEGGPDALAHAAALEFEAEFEVEELFEDEALVRGGDGGHQVSHGRAGFREVDGAEGGEAGGEFEAG